MMSLVEYIQEQRIDESPSLTSLVSDDLFDKIKHRKTEDIEDIMYEFIRKCFLRLKDNKMKTNIRNALSKAMKL